MLRKNKNPFEYEGANNLSDDEILDFYIEDYNFSRFIQSTRNIFLIGERGAGKTMALLYNSFRLQYKKNKKGGERVSFEKIGIHIPCNTPLFHKKEHLLLQDDFKASIIAEHYLVLSVVFAIAKTLSEIPEIKNNTKKYRALKADVEYLWGIKLIQATSFFDAIAKFVEKEIVQTQVKINNSSQNDFYKNAFSFSSLVMPFFATIKKVPLLKHSHFMLLIDDAHDLNKFQTRALNSWISYRDHSAFSFKIATAKVNQPEFITSTGGSILEGHDFTSVDMEKPFQNKDSDFHKMALRIITKRLEKTNVDANAQSFFPINPLFKKELDECDILVRKEAEKKYSSKKQINDYVYKYGRAEYFRQRSKKANQPPYSGVDMIVDLSTGVIRNLLDPCYWMYDAELSEGRNRIKCIPWATQNKIIVERSKRLWERLQNGLDKEIDGCSTEQAKHIFNLFNNLIALFKKRLHDHKSEPRAIMFTISQKEELVMVKIDRLLEIALKAQFIYTRLGNAKDDGKVETYYVPNRMLFPSVGLDPHGQYSRVSLKAKDILAAAEKNKNFPFVLKDEEKKETQGYLFDEKI